MPDGGVAPGGAAGDVPGDEGFPEGSGERAAAPVAVGQGVIDGVGEQPAHPHLHPVGHPGQVNAAGGTGVTGAGVGVGVEVGAGGAGAGQVPGQGRGDRAVPGQAGRGRGGTEQGGVGHHQVELHVEPAHDRVDAGHPGDEGVGADLVDRPVVPGGFEALGCLVQRRPAGDAFGHRQVGGQVGHHIRCRADRHLPVLDRLPAPGHEGVRVQLVGQRVRGRLGAPVGHPRQLVGQGLIDPAAVLHGQARGRPGDHGRGPLRDQPRRQSPQRVGHLLHQRPRQPQVPRPPGRGLPPGQRDLGTQPGRGLARRDPVRQALGDLGVGEVHTHPRLRGRRRTLQRLQHPQQLHPGRIVQTGRWPGRQHVHPGPDRGHRQPPTCRAIARER